MDKTKSKKLCQNAVLNVYVHQCKRFTCSWTEISIRTVLTNVVININIIMNIVEKSSYKQTYDAWA